MYENGQGHLTFFCIVFCLTRGTLQKKWFMYQNRLGPSDGIYYPNFVPCFVYHQLNYSLAQISADRETRKASLNSQVQTSKSFNLFVEGALEIKRKERVNNGWISLQT